MTMSKRTIELEKKVERNKQYVLQDACKLVKETANAKFDETVELHVRLGVDPKQSDQNVRGVVALPHGTGKSKRVAVIAKGEKVKEAEASGADVVGAEDLIERISKGEFPFDVLVATPDMMKDLSKVAKLLGPKGLMPNPKSGTVTFDVGRTVKELKAGRIEFKLDAYGIVHVPIGKASFPVEHLTANATALLDSISHAKPASSKGVFMKSVSIASTMGPGIKIAATQTAE